MSIHITGSDRERLQKHLTAGEKLLWCGKAEPSLLDENVVAGVNIAIAFTGMPLLLDALYGPILPSGKIYALILVGVALIVGYPICYLCKRKKWLYGLTEQRALMLMHGEVREYPLAPGIALSAYIPARGKGSIFFETEVRNKKNRSKTYDYGFLLCPDAATTLSILQERLAGAALRG